MMFTYVSPSVEGLRGYTPEEVMAEPMDAALSPESSRLVREGLIRRMHEFERDGDNEGVFATTEVEQPCKDGSLVQTEVVTSYYRNPRTGRGGSRRVPGHHRPPTRRGASARERSALPGAGGACPLRAPREPGRPRGAREPILPRAVRRVRTRTT